MTTAPTSGLTDAAKCATARASWIDLIKYHGLSEVYTRPRLARAAEMWDADAGEWEAEGWEAHRAYWASVGVPCGREGCAHH